MSGIGPQDYAEAALHCTQISQNTPDIQSNQQDTGLD